MDLQVNSYVGLLWIAGGALLGYIHVGRFRQAIRDETPPSSQSPEPASWAEWRAMMREPPTDEARRTRGRLFWQLWLGAAIWIVGFLFLAQVF